MQDIEKPPRVQPSLKSAPRIRQLFWCDFPKDAQLPEFWKRRPVIVISKSATLHGTVVVLPCSTSADQDLTKAIPLLNTIDGRAAWAVCDKPSTIAVSRLLPSRGIVPRLPEGEFNKVLTLMLKLLPKPRNE